MGCEPRTLRPCHTFNVAKMSTHCEPEFYDKCQVVPHEKCQEVPKEASKNLSWSSAQNVHPDQRHPTFHLQLPNSLRTLSPLISTSHFMMIILFHIFLKQKTK